MNHKLLLSALCAVLAAAWCFAAPEAKEQTVWETDVIGKYRVVGTVSAPGARAEVGDRITLKLEVKTQQPGRFGVVFYVNGEPQGEEKSYGFGETVEFTTVAKSPGTVSAIGSLVDQDGKPVLNERKRPASAGVGVLVSPEKIRPGNLKEPADFDEFWKKRRAELDKIPVKAERQEVEGHPKYPGVVCYDVQVDCTGNVPVSGYLCMPRDAKPKSLPAIVTYHGAGVRSANKQFGNGVKALAFDVNAHGLPNGRPESFYKDAYAGPLKSYYNRGFKDDREIYFFGMYDRVMRALDYVKSLPEWDGKILVVMGGSQGGGQSIAAAGLDPQVTLCCAVVPALCDLGGALAGRRPGWPAPLPPRTKRISSPEVIARTAYVDGVFFARRIKCPVYMSTGLVDQTCVAPAVFSAYNSLPAGTEKHIAVNPVGNHGTSRTPEGIAAVRRQLGLE